MFFLVLTFSIPFIFILALLVFKLLEYCKLRSKRAYILAGVFMGVPSGIFAWKIEILSPELFFESEYFIAAFITSVICALVFWHKVIKQSQYE
jgi:hypothetical protein